MPDTSLFFWKNVQEFFSSVLPRGIPLGFEERLRGAGVDLKSPLVRADPLTVVGPCIELGASWLFPTEPREQAWRHLGERAGAIWTKGPKGAGKTTLGRAVWSMCRMLGWRESLHRFGSLWPFFRPGQSLFRVMPTGGSSNRVEVWFNETNEPLRHFAAGWMSALLHELGARQCQVDLRSTEEGCTLSLSWKDPAARGP